MKFNETMMERRIVAKIEGRKVRRWEGRDSEGGMRKAKEKAGGKLGN